MYLVLSGVKALAGYEAKLEMTAYTLLGFEVGIGAITLSLFSALTFLTEAISIFISNYLIKLESIYY